MLRFGWGDESPGRAAALLDALLGQRAVGTWTGGPGRSHHIRRNFEIDAQAIVRASLRAINEIVVDEMDVERRGFKEVTSLASTQTTALRPRRGLPHSSAPTPPRRRRA
jgi:hypothetical protein